MTNAPAASNPANGSIHERHLGLSPAEVLERRAQFGENRLPAEKGVSVWSMLLEQIKSPLVYIILVAAWFRWLSANSGISGSSWPSS